MNPEQINKYFGAHVIYQFTGSAEELLNILSGQSVNYMTANYINYFITDTVPPADNRITVFADNTQGVA